MEAIHSENNSLQYKLGKRAQHLERQFSMLDAQPKPMDWEEFNEKHPAEKVRSKASRLGFHATLGAAASLGVILSGLFRELSGQVGTNGATALSVIAENAGYIGLASGAGLGVGAVMGAAIGAFVIALSKDRQPEIHQKQLQKYRDHLDDFEMQHQPALEQARADELASQEQEAEEEKWVDRLEQAATVATEIMPG